jgi:hypothetical protein
MSRTAQRSGGNVSSRPNGTPRGPGLPERLKARREPPKSLIDSVKAQMVAQLPTLGHDELRTARKIVGEAFWSQLPRGQRTAAGAALAYLVAIKAVPLIFAGRNRANHNLYRLG